MMKNTIKTISHDTFPYFLRFSVRSADIILLNFFPIFYTFLGNLIIYMSYLLFYSNHSHHSCDQGLDVSRILESTDLVRDPNWDIFTTLCNASTSPCWQLDRQVNQVGSLHFFLFLSKLKKICHLFYAHP